MLGALAPAVLPAPLSPLHSSPGSWLSVQDGSCLPVRLSWFCGPPWWSCRSVIEVRNKGRREGDRDAGGGQRGKAQPASPSHCSHLSLRRTCAPRTAGHLLALPSGNSCEGDTSRVLRQGRPQTGLTRGQQGTGMNISLVRSLGAASVPDVDLDWQKAGRLRCDCAGMKVP